MRDYENGATSMLAGHMKWLRVTTNPACVYSEPPFGMCTHATQSGPLGVWSGAGCTRRGCTDPP